MYFLYDVKNAAEFAKKGQRMSDDEYLARYKRTRKEVSESKKARKKKTPFVKPIDPSNTPTQNPIQEAAQPKAVPLNPVDRNVKAPKVKSKPMYRKAYENLSDTAKDIGGKVKALPLKSKIGLGVGAVGITVGGALLINKLRNRKKKKEDSYEQELKQTWKGNAYYATAPDRTIRRTQKVTESLRNTGSALRSVAYAADTARRWVT